MSTTPVRNAVLWLLVIVALVLSVFACYFAPERILFSDTAFYAQELVTRGNFYIATNRFISVLAQVLPVPAVIAGLPLSTVVSLYSLNFTLIPVLAALICWFPLKNRGAAVAVLLYYVLMSRDVFYYPVSEFQIGMVLLFVFHALFTRFIKDKAVTPFRYYLCGAVLLVTITFSHPLSFLVLAGWLAWMLPAIRKYSGYSWIFPAVTVAVTYKLRSFFQFNNAAAYEDAKSEGLANFASLKDYWDYTLTDTFIKQISHDYFYLPVIAALVIIVCIFRRRWWHLLLFTLLISGFMLLITVSFREMKYDYYTEHLMAPLPFFLALACCTLVLPGIRNRFVQPLFVVVLFLFPLLKIYNNHVFYSDRLQWYRNYFQLMEAGDIRKAGLSREHITVGELGSYWSAPSESLLLSSLNGPEHSRTLLLVWNFDNLKQPIGSPGLFLYDGWERPINELPERYFRLDPEKPYAVLDSLFPRPVLDSLAYANLHRFGNARK